jgi:threonine synthase
LKAGECGVFLETAHPAKFKDSVDAITGGDVEIPARLQAFMKGVKQSVGLSSDYADFRNFLFEESK